MVDPILMNHILDEAPMTLLSPFREKSRDKDCVPPKNDTGSMDHGGKHDSLFVNDTEVESADESEGEPKLDSENEDGADSESDDASKFVEDGAITEVMAMARYRLTKLRYPIRKCDGSPLWWFKKKDELWLLVGYGSDDPNDHDREDYIIGFRISSNNMAWSEVVAVKSKNPVKYARTAGRHTRVLDPNIPLKPADGDQKQAKKINDWLKEHFVQHYHKAIAAFGGKVKFSKSREAKKGQQKVVEKSAKSAQGVIRGGQGGGSRGETCRYEPY